MFDALGNAYALFCANWDTEHVNREPTPETYTRRYLIAKRAVEAKADQLTKEDKLQPVIGESQKVDTMFSQKLCVIILEWQSESGKFVIPCFSVPAGVPPCPPTIHHVYTFLCACVCLYT